MLKWIWFLAAVDGLETPVIKGEASKIFGYSVRDLLLLVGMGLILATALFLFAYLTRKKRATIGLAHSRAIYRAEPQEDSERRRYRKRRRRRGHPEFLPRNPTLQETGGLPPPRPEQPPAEPTQ